jgi:hypothetical protein
MSNEIVREAQITIIDVLSKRLEDLELFVNGLPAEATPTTVLNGMLFIDTLNPILVPDDYYFIDGAGATEEGEVVGKYQSLFEGLHKYLEDKEELNLTELKDKIKTLKKRIA